MKIQTHNSINSNNNLSFNGSIHNSVPRFLNTVRAGIIKSEKSPCVYESGNVHRVSTLEQASKLMQKIINRLKSFIEQTDKDTEFFFDTNKNTGVVYPCFKNKKATIRGFRITERSYDGGKTADVEGVNVARPHLIKKSGKLFGLIKPKYDLTNLESLDAYTSSLVKDVKPADVDKALQDKAIVTANELITLKQENIARAQVQKAGKRNIKQAIKVLKDVDTNFKS